MRFMLLAMALALPACSGCSETKEPENKPPETAPAVAPTPTAAPAPTAAAPAPAAAAAMRTPTADELKDAIKRNNEARSPMNAFAPRQVMIGGQKVLMRPPRGLPTLRPINRVTPPGSTPGGMSIPPPAPAPTPAPTP